MIEHNDRSAESKSAKDFYDMSGPDLLDYCGADASKWAEAFCKIKEAQGWGVDDIDQGLMITWFANAIEHSSMVRRIPDDAQSAPVNAAALTESLIQAAVDYEAGRIGRPALSAARAAVEAAIAQPPAAPVETKPFYGAECPSYPNCNGGCGLGCTHEVERHRRSSAANGGEK